MNLEAARSVCVMPINLHDTTWTDSQYIVKEVQEESHIFYACLDGPRDESGTDRWFVLKDLKTGTRVRSNRLTLEIYMEMLVKIMDTKE